MDVQVSSPLKYIHLKNRGLNSYDDRYFPKVVAIMSMN